MILTILQVHFSVCNSTVCDISWYFISTKFGHMI